MVSSIKFEYKVCGFFIGLVMICEQLIINAILQQSIEDPIAHFLFNNNNKINSLHLLLNDFSLIVLQFKSRTGPRNIYGMSSKSLVTWFKH